MRLTGHSVRGATLRTEADLQAVADRTRHDQTLLVVDKIEIAGTCAVVEASIQIARPRSDPRSLTCCCTSTDVYKRRRDGSWTLDRNLGALCA